MENTNISSESLKQLKELLPHGAMDKIAELTKYHPNYVSNFFGGRYPVNSTNIKIVEEAQKIIEADKKIIEDKAKNLNEFLSKNKA